MNQTAPLPPAPPCQALICLAPADDGATPRRVLGRWLGEWQVDHAVDAGCHALFLLGGGGSEEAVAVRLASEKQGLRVREIATPHALAGALAPGEMLLVMQPQLLPGRADWHDQPAGHGLVVTFPAPPAVQAGFERIDLSRAWAGLLLMPGGMVQRLLELPEDVEAAPALLRIALQWGVPDWRMGEDALADGTWTVLGRGVPVRSHEEKWLAQRLRPVAGEVFSRRLCTFGLRKWGGGLPGKPGALPGALGLSGALVAGGAALAFQGLGAGAFAVLALAALALEFALALSAIQRRSGAWQARLPMLRWVIDLAVLACGYLSVEGRWFRQLFPALVLVLGLNASHRASPAWIGALHDRPLACALVALLAAFSSVEVALILVSGALMLANLGRKP